MNDLQQQLQQLYHDNSKHSNYQSVPSFVRDALGYQEFIDESWRGDTARYTYLLQELDLQSGDRVADIGANTGFFVLSLAHSHPKCRFVAYENHPNHVDFIRLVAGAFELDNVVVQEQVVDMAAIDGLPNFDVLLHLNVLHHAGHDFDPDLVNGLQQIDMYAETYLARLAAKASTLVFQIGYNWGGDKTRPIINPQDQTSMVAWLTGLLHRSGWQVLALAFATRDGCGEIVYQNLPPELIDVEYHSAQGVAALQQAIHAYRLEQFKGEFYRRPLVICRSTERNGIKYSKSIDTQA